MAAAKKQTTTSKSRTAKSAAKSAGGARKTGSAKKAASSGSSASSGRKKSAAAKSKNSSSAVRRAAEEKREIDYGLIHEVFVLVVLFFSILMFISLIGMGGALGRALSRLQFGLFGTMAYVFPFVFFFGTAFLVSNTASRHAVWRFLGAVLLFLTLCGFFGQVLNGYQSGLTFGDYFESGAQFRQGGGGVGGSLQNLIDPLLGIVGSYIAMVILTLVSLIMITGKSLLGPVKNSGKRVVRGMRSGVEGHHAWAQDQKRLKEEQRLRDQAALEARREQERLEEKTSLPVNITILPREEQTLRRSRRVKGVSTNTQIAPYGKPEQERRPGEGEARQIYPGLTETTLSPVTVKRQQDEPVDVKRTRKKRIVPELSFESEPAEEEVVLASEPSAMKSLRINMPIQEQEKQETPKKEPVKKPAVKDAAPLHAREENDPDETRTRETDIPEETAEEAAEAPAKAPRAARKPRASQEEIIEGINTVQEEIDQQKAAEEKTYAFPPLSLMKKPGKKGGMTRGELEETAQKLARVFETFGVNVHITNVTCGPSVTRYELTPELGVKVSKIVSLQDDIMLNLAASDIRIEAPIPGKAAVGIEVPNTVSTGVSLREILESPEFKEHPSPIAYAVGRDIAGKVIVSDIGKMPHLLIAGATGSGKSVFINTLIMSILYKSSPEDVKLIMIDPKVVELSVYNGIPHLYIPVVTDPKKAAGALNWAVAEMTARYEKFASVGVRDIKGYNKRVEEVAASDVEEKPEKMPKIVIIVDELADLMMVSSSEVEEAICRLAQLARAAGIHLVIATQRPSVDVITGLIKANMPSRIAFAVSSGVDSRTILDMVGAEKLLGNGDMLFAPSNYKQPLRVQGAFISDQEVAAIVDYLKTNNGQENYSRQMEERLETVAKAAAAAGGGDTDELFAEAGKFIIEKDKASIGMLQRWFKIGFNRAARIMDQLSDAGVVGPEEGTKPRKILMSMEQFENYLEAN